MGFAEFDFNDFTWEERRTEQFRCVHNDMSVLICCRPHLLTTVWWTRSGWLIECTLSREFFPHSVKWVEKQTKVTS